MYRNKYLLILLLVNLVSADNDDFVVIKKVLQHCTNQKEVSKCLKIQVLKTVDRAFGSKNLSIFDGVNVVDDDRRSRSAYFGLNLNESKLQKLDSDEIDHLLEDVSSRYLDSHHLEINVPRLLEEGRGKKKGGGNGALYWALAIKGSFLAMAYQGISAMSGLALVMGKMALLLSAILGLQKLIGGSHETTTVEIVKQPKYSEQHSYSTSYEDDSPYHRSYDYNSSPPFSKRHKTYT